MKPWVKKTLLGVAAGIVVAGAGFGAFGWLQTSSYDASMEKVYDVPLPSLSASPDAASVARGKHLSESLAGCSLADCHGTDLAGGKSMVMGPLGTITGPNITAAGLGAAYSDAELAKVWVKQA